MSAIRSGQDPRATIRGDLVAAARRRAATRRRRRTVALAALALAALLATTAGAAVLGGYTTGSPTVDEAVTDSWQRFEAGQRRLERAFPGRERLERFPDHRPGPGSPSPPLAVRMPDGPWSRDWVATAYLNRDGTVCLALADRDQAPDEGTRAGFACLRGWTPEAIADRVEEDLAFAPGQNLGNLRILHGFARADVDAVRVRGPRGTVPAAITEPWSPRRGAKPIRMFAAVVELEVDDPRHLTPEELRRLPTAQDLPLEVVLSDGRRVQVPRPDDR